MALPNVAFFSSAGRLCQVMFISPILFIGIRTLAETLNEWQAILAELAENPRTRQPQLTKHSGVESSIS